MKKDDAEVVESAKEIASRAETWADFSNALFDPTSGILTKAYPTRKEREAFVKSKGYQAIRSLLESAMAGTGLVAGATPRKSGRFVVRLPRSLHAALEREAVEEGVSLNQLVVAKLALQMSHVLAPQPESHG